jgi:hypothetical protein
LLRARQTAHREPLAAVVGGRASLLGLGLDREGCAGRICESKLKTAIPLGLCLDARKALVVVRVGVPCGEGEHVVASADRGHALVV